MLPQFDNTEIAFQYRSDKDMGLAKILFSSMNSPFITAAGIAATRVAIKLHLPVNGLIRKTIYKQFCGGENIREAAATAERIGKYNVDVILDYGVEGKEAESEFDHAKDELIKAIAFAADKKNIPFVSMKVTGFARFALLEKLNSKEELTAAEKEEWQRVRRRIEDIGAAAGKYHVMILVDAEETWIQEPVNELTEMMMSRYNKKEVLIFNTYQFYSHGTLDYLKWEIDNAKAKGFLLGAKLVRGAYMEKERARAAEKGYQDPIQPNKESTDRDYDAGVKLCLDNLDKLAVFIGTHNENSCLKAAQYMEQLGIPAQHPRVFFSQLYGMGDNISFNLAHEGYHVSKYLPYGPVKDVVPYLMRRAEENTSVAGQTGRELSLVVKEIKRRGL